MRAHSRVSVVMEVAVRLWGLVPCLRRLSTVAVLLAPALGSAEPFTFVTTPGSDSVAVIDLATHTVVATLPVGGLPAGGAVGPNGVGLYVSLSESNALAMIATAKEGPRVVRVPVGTGPTGVAVAPRRGRVYVANTGADTVSAIDIDDGVVVATIPVGDGPLALAAGPTRVYVANWGAGTVSVIDAALNSVVATIPVGTFPAGLALHTGTRRLYVSNFFDDTVSVIDTTTQAVVSTIPVTRRPRGLATDAAGQRLFVAGFDDGRVQAVDTGTGTVALDVPSGGLNPLDLMLGPGGTRLYVTHLQGADGVSVLDAATLAPVATVDVPAGAVAFAGLSDEGPTSLPLDWWPDASRLLASGPEVKEAPVGRPGGVPSRGDAVVIVDSDFDDEDWVVSGPAEQVTFQEPTGGNPGAWRRTTHFGQGETTHRLIRPGAVYNPSTLGAIDRIDVSWDRRLFAETIASERFFVEQNSVVYRTSERSFFSPAWENDQRAGLHADAFTNGSGGHPDFSDSGGPLRFGYVRRTFNQTVPHGIDNFTVTIHREPPNLAGRLALQRTTEVVEEGDTPFVWVDRLDGALGAVSVTIRTLRPDGTSIDETLSWADGDTFPKNILVVSLNLPPGAGARTARVTLLDPTGGALIDPARGKLAIIVFPDEWPPVLQQLFLRLNALFGAFSPAWLLVLAVPAAALAVRHARSRRRAASVS